MDCPKKKSRKAQTQFSSPLDLFIAFAAFGQLASNPALSNAAVASRAIEIGKEIFNKIQEDKEKANG